MAGDDEEVPPPPPAQPAAVVPEHGRLAMPEFAGNEGQADSIVSMQAEAFLNNYNNWAGACAYTDIRKAQAFNNALTKDAQAWLVSITRKKAFDVQNWELLQRAFKDRFISKLAPHYIATEMSKLQQRPNEAVRTFFDRCQLAQTLMDADWNTPEQPNPAYNAENLRTAYATGWANACKKISDNLTLHHFLRNLKPEISTRLASCTTLTTIEEHVDAANKIQAAIRDKRQVAAIDTAELSAVTTRPQRRPQKKSSPPPPTYVCRLCQIKGHWIYECKLSDKVRNGGAQQRSPNRQTQQAPRHLGMTPQPTQNQWQPKSFPINKASPLDAQQQFNYAQTQHLSLIHISEPTRPY